MINSVVKGTRDYAVKTANHIVNDTGAKRSLLIGAAFIFDMMGQADLCKFAKDLNKGFTLLDPLKLVGQWNDYLKTPNASIVTPLMDTVSAASSLASLGMRFQIIKLGIYTTPFGIAATAFDVVSYTKSAFEGAVSIYTYKKDTDNLKKRVIVKLDKWKVDNAAGDNQKAYFEAKRNKWNTKLSRWNKFMLPQRMATTVKNANLAAISVMSAMVSFTPPLAAPLLIVSGVTAAVGVTGVFLKSAMIVDKVAPQQYGLPKDFRPKVKPD